MADSNFSSIPNPPPPWIRINPPEDVHAKALALREACQEWTPVVPKPGDVGVSVEAQACSAVLGQDTAGWDNFAFGVLAALLGVVVGLGIYGIIRSVWRVARQLIGRAA